MKLTEEEIKLKNEFIIAFKKFAESLNEEISYEDGQWTIKGFIDIYKKLYTISSDTKIISKILEIHLYPTIKQFAESIGYKVKTADMQNWYPDFSFIKKDNDKIKYAVDLKTTFRLPFYPGFVNGFTLGSHGKYFKERDSKKNIQFPYNFYQGHFCLGVIYSRPVLEKEVQEGILPSDELKEIQKDQDEDIVLTSELMVKTIEDIESIVSVIKDFKFFFCEKWKIASDKPGSGNTANIGSIFYIEDILKENGRFINLGEDVFDDYWQKFNDPIIPKDDGSMKKLRNLEDYMKYRNIDENLLNKTQTKKGKKIVVKSKTKQKTSRSKKQND